VAGEGERLLLLEVCMYALYSLYTVLTIHYTHYTLYSLLLLLEVWDDFSGGDELVGTARLEVLYSYFTHTIPTLYSHWTHTILTLYSYCIHTIPTLYSYCTHTALTMEVSSLKRTAWAEFEERQVQYIIHYAPYTILI
jgi:hypothetical protein